MIAKEKALKDALQPLKFVDFQVLCVGHFCSECEGIRLCSSLRGVMRIMVRFMTCCGSVHIIFAWNLLWLNLKSLYF